MDRLVKLERQVRALRLCVVLLAAAWVFSIFARASRAEEKPTNLTARRIAVVDERGVERVVISAPSPDPIVRGERKKRAGPVSGILIYDKNGNERGGYLTADDASNGAMLTLDAVDGQVFTAYANADNGATLSLQNQKGGGVTLTTWNAPVIQMKQKGKILFNQPPDAPVLH